MSMFNSEPAALGEVGDLFRDATAEAGQDGRPFVSLDQVSIDSLAAAIVSAGDNSLPAGAASIGLRRPIQARSLRFVTLILGEYEPSAVSESPNLTDPLGGGQVIVAQFIDTQLAQRVLYLVTSSLGSACQVQLVGLTDPSVENPLGHSDIGSPVTLPAGKATTLGVPMGAAAWFPFYTLRVAVVAAETGNFRVSSYMQTWAPEVER